MNQIHNRALCYLVVATGLTVGYLFLRTSSWQGSAELHTLMEVIATFLAFMVGSMALVRYYSKHDDKFLIIGTGFLGTGFLDGYHALVTSYWFKGYLPSELSSLIPWSWTASRLFLAVVLYYSYWNWHSSQKSQSKSYLSPKLIYAWTAFITLSCFLFFVFFPLPRAYYPIIVFHRPQEFVPAVFFALALFGYLHKGAWRNNSFEHWLVLALIVNLVLQTVFMSLSRQLFDLEFDAAHLLKNLSYLCVLVGLFINMYDSFQQVEKEVSEKTTVQTALEISRVRYRTVIDTVLEGIITINEHGIVASMNPAAEKTFGFLSHEVIGQNIKILMPEPYRSEHDSYLKNYLSTGVAKIIGVGREVQGRRKDGTVFPMELGVSEMVVDGRRMFTGLVRDITERKNFEMALSNNKERLRAVINAVLEGIITINERGIVATMNPAAESIFGYQADEVIGHNIKMLMPDPYQSEHDDYLNNYLTTGIAKIIGTGREVKGLRKNGEVFPMELSVSEIQIDKKRMFIGLVRDITERKNYEQELNDSRNRLTLATRAGRIGVWDYNLNDGSLIWDDRMFQIYGVNRTQFPGAYEAWQNALHPEEKERVESELKKGVSGEQDFDTEFRILWPDKSVHTIKAAGVVLHDENQKAQRMIGVNWDISKQKEIDTMKNEFISTVSHELRTPLTSIQGSLELMLSGTVGEVPEDCMPLLEIASNNSARLVRLINDILDIEKIEYGKMEFDLKPVDLMTIIQQSIDANQAYADEYGVKLAITRQVTDCFVKADHDRLMQVLTNLLSNAAKFSPEGENVDVDIVLLKNSVRVCVTDYGPGIPVAFRERIFSKFSQADSSSSKQQGGTGLGLNICKAIVEKLGGHIDYESEINKKTCFYFDLPIYQDENIPVDLEKADKSNEVILICEDDPDIARLLKLMLEKNGRLADIAVSAEQAKLKLLEKHYHAMTLDLKLPGQSGIDFFTELRQTKGQSDLPVIVVSAFVEEGKQAINGDAIAVYDWLDKPIDENRLESAITKALSTKQTKLFNILHVEDDSDIVSLVNTLLKNKATVEVAADLKTARTKLEHDYDLVILDLTLPDGSGSVLLPELANRVPPIPVVIFSAQDNNESLKDSVRANFVKSKTSNEDLIRSIELILNHKDQSIKG